VRLEGLVAISLAHISHLLSVLALFQLTLAIFPARSSRFAIVASLLHIISPAGLFLSAPYAESSCALLSFCGCLLFSKSFGRHGVTSTASDALVVLSGILFGLATTLRSNGILNGLLLLEEAVRTLLRLRHGLKFFILRRLIFTGLSGVIVACGLFLPQYIAYTEYCMDAENTPRPWCERTMPSIYTFVQDYYWNCGLFRYWTSSNLPLFALAAPMFALLIKSSLWVASLPSAQCPGEYDTKVQKQTQEEVFYETQVFRNMALSQFALGVLTLSTAHVQIISRISSACPVWMWYIASLLSQEKAHRAGPIVKFMVVYAIVQGGLFASFLPPA
jgi:phosphatidylinositol glycan class V